MFIRTNISRHNRGHLGRPGSTISSSTLTRCFTGQTSGLPASHRLLSTPTRQELRPSKRPLRSLTTYLPERRLATTLGEYTALDDIPFDRLSAVPTSTSTPSPSRFYDVKPFNTSNLLMLEEPTNTIRPRSHTSLAGLPADLDELVPMFNACLHVGKLDRAALVLTRMVEKRGSLAPEILVGVINKYLRAWIARARADIADFRANSAEHLHKMYELNVNIGKLPQTPETIAYMVKASLLTTDNEKRLQRLVTRYMGMVQGPAGLEVLYCTDILSDSDRATIINICPQYNNLLINDEPPESQVADEVIPARAVVDSTDLPEVLSTDQKGMGLNTVKRTLSLFRDLEDDQDISSLSPEDRREFQARLEHDCVQAAVDRWRSENEELLKMGLNTSLSSASMNAKCYDWQTALQKRLEEELAAIDLAENTPKKNNKDVDRCLYGPFLRQSTPERLAAVTILTTITAVASTGVDRGSSLILILNNLSRVAEEDVKSQMRSKDQPRESRFTKERSLRAMQRKKKHHIPSEKATDDQTFDPETFLDKPWPLSIKVKVAAALLSALIDTAKIVVVREHPDTKEQVSQIQPAFQHAIHFKKGKKHGVLQVNAALGEMMRKEPRGDFLARHLPMVSEPLPWTGFEKGGYMEYPVPMVRVKNGEKDQRIYVEEALARGDMEQVTKGLDVLGKTAWRINNPVFRVMLEAWNTGEAIANLPPLNPNIPVPPEPQTSTDPLERRRWLKAIKLAENQRSSFHSIRCFMNFQMEIARAYRNQTFYFPHNIDFRGRAYPIPTYLNHMGADHVRGLLLFAKGKELGERGLKWLKVHLSNVFGFDKASLKEREEFAVKNLDNILDSVNNPLTGKKWWMQAEDPWQCLATCFELKAAMELPDPTKYVSHLPVHQDGTCNGLQHYAALGGDSWGARQVNLEPGDKPADVYSAVADLVNEGIAADVAAGNEFAKALQGKIKRKVVKQTVMTNVYGVTFSGARKQVQKQLENLYPNLEKETGFSSSLLSSYVATKIFKGLGTMFRGAHDIQFWLGEIGNRVCCALTADQLTKLVEGTAVSESKSKDMELNEQKDMTLKKEEAEMPVGEASAIQAEKPVIRTKKQIDKNRLAREKYALARDRPVPEENVLEDTVNEKSQLVDELAVLEEKESTSKREKVVDPFSKEVLDKELRSTIIWTTPLRMPIVQPYRKSNNKVISTCLQNLILTLPERFDPVNRRKQLQAFPPNFIHSLDASHMMLSALECDELGLSFAAVHDSFWTHAADVDVMNRVLRDAFIRIHSEDVIGRLLAEFQARYKNGVYLATIQRKTEAGKAIVDFRKRGRRPGSKKFSELAMEKKRLDLLNSSDAKEREEGEKMVTPASIFARLSKSADLVAEDLGVHGLGTISSTGSKSSDVPLEAEDVDAGQEDEGETADAEQVIEDAEESAMGDDEDYKGSLVAKVMKNVTMKRSGTLVVKVWLPLSFPDIPAKGDFDVNRLKTSEYFFS